MSVTQLGEKIVNNVLNSAGLIPMDASQPAISFKASEDDISSEDSKERNYKETLATKIRRQTTKAIKNLFENGHIKESMKEEEDLEDLLEEKENVSKIGRSMLNSLHVELNNLAKNKEANESYIVSEEDSDESVLSVRRITEIKREKRKIDLNLLKNKRKTINMRLAFLSPSEKFKDIIKKLKFLNTQ